MIKTKLSTQDKSKKCSISKCKYPSIIKIKLGLETRRLCKIHYDISIGKYNKHPPIFIKAINL